MKKLNRAGQAIALLSVAAIALTGCGRANDSGDGPAQASPGITDDSITLGGSFPLSGALALHGQEELYGTQALFDRINDEGGVTMGDGKTRKIDFVYYDDAYDPARLVQNFRRLVDQDQVFGTFGMFGTASNLAAMPIATELKVPQVYLGTGASVFSSDREKNPYTLGWWPAYENEASAFGEYLASLNKPIKVAFMAQNDDQGEAYLAGLKSAIEGSQVTIVKQASFESTDTVLDSQVSSLAASGADAFFSGVNVTATQTAVLKKLGELQWYPITYLPIVSSGVEVVEDAGAQKFLPELFSSSFSKRVCEPEFVNDDDVKQYQADIKKYTPDADGCFVNTIWGYAIADTMVKTLEQTKEPTRDAFMDAIKNLKLDNIALVRDELTFDGGNLGQPPISDLEVQKFKGDGWETQKIE